MKANLIRTVGLLALISCLSVAGYSLASRRLDGAGDDDSKKSRTTIQGTAKTKVDTDREHSGAYWFSRGYELHQESRYVEAIGAFSHSIALGYRQATGMYNVACGFALLNDTDNALFWLKRSLAIGFDRPDLLRSDSDLDPLRSDPRFKEMLQTASLTEEKNKELKEKPEKPKRDKLDEAVSTFEQLKRESSRDGDQWYKAGTRLLNLRDLDRATVALTEAVDHLDYRGQSAMYNLACAYALKGDRAHGIQWLEKAVNAGFDDSDKLRDDSDITNLRTEPRFKQIQELSRTLSLSRWNSDGSDDSQYSKTRWAPAVKEYEAFVHKHPENGRAYFNLGYALHYSSEHEKAIEAFRWSLQLGYKKPTSMYNLACANAMLKRTDAAFDWLEKSVDAGFEVGNYADSDPDLESLRADPRFKRFRDIARAQHKYKDK